MQFSAKLLTPILLAMTLAACGGGSSSSKDSGGSLSYTGKTTPANFSSLTNSEKEAVAGQTLAAVGAAMDASESNNFLPVVTFPNGIQATSSPSLRQTVQQQAQLVLKQHSQVQSMGLAQGIATSMDCPSGGKITFSGDFNHETGIGSLTTTFASCKYDAESGTSNGKVTFKATAGKTRITFDNYSYTDEEGTTKIQGYFEFAGNFVGDTDEIDAVSAEWDISVTVGGQADRSKGSIACTAASCTITTLVQDQGKTYKVKLTTASTVTEETLEVEISHPDFGTYTVSITITEYCDGSDNFDGDMTISDDSGNEIFFTSSCDDGLVLDLP